MNTKTLPILLTITVAVLLTVACSTLLPAQPQEADVDALYTQAASTVHARMTQQAYDDLVALLTQAAPQATSTATQAPAEPTATLVSPTATPTPTPLPLTATPIPCNQVAFVKDVTVPDGTIFPPGADFTKVWRLQNVGSCNWSDSYSLVFVDGTDMTEKNAYPLPGTVRPGESVDLSVAMEAPTKSGTYQASWMLRSPEGHYFGLGASADRVFWARIQVSFPEAREDYNYDLAANVCAASWRSSDGVLPCPGWADSSAGSVILMDRPVLENGRHEDELTLWTRPEATRGGWIQGVYPAYKVKANDHFMADLGCLADSKNCDVTFRLDYRIGDDPIKKLGEWREVYDGHLSRVDIDLSGLAGEKVQFILSVTGDGKPAHNNAFWLVPSIQQSSPTPTPGLDTTPAAQAARAAVAQGIGVGSNEVRIYSVVVTQWSDTCLGVHIPDQVCAPAVVDGYRVTLESGNRRFEAHTNEDGSTVYWFEI
jgi:hypothetical protein